MTMIQPASPNNASGPPKAHAHKRPPEGGDNAAFLALLALLAPPTADPTVPKAGTGPTDPHAVQADVDTAQGTHGDVAQGIHGRDGQKNLADDKRKDALPAPGAGLLLPMPVLIGSLAPTQQPNATSDARTPGIRRAALLPPDVTDSQVAVSKAVVDRVAQAQAAAATTDRADEPSTAKIPQQSASIFNVRPPPAPDVAPVALANPLQPAMPTSTVLSASHPVPQPAHMQIQESADLLVASSNVRKKVQATTEPLRTDFAPIHTPAPAATAVVAKPAASTPPPGMATAVQQIVAQAQLIRQGQATEMRLRLRPPELGEVRVTLRRDGEGKLAVHLVPATPEGEAALRTNLHHLQATLDQQSVGQGADVSLGQRESSHSQQHARHENHRNGEWDNAAPTNTPVGPSASRITRATTSSRTGNGAVDYDA